MASFKRQRLREILIGSLALAVLVGTVNPPGLATTNSVEPQAAAESTTTPATAPVDRSPQTVAGVVTSVKNWKPDESDLKGLPKNLFVVNKVPVLPSMPVEKMTEAEVEEARKAWETQGPALSVTALQTEPARVGGYGTARISLPRRNDPGVKVRKLKVNLELPSGTSVQAAAGEGWECSQTQCVHPETLAPSSFPLPIDVKIATSSDVAVGQLNIPVKASWEEQELRNGIGQPHGIPGSFEVVGWHKKSQTSQATLIVDPPLTISAKASSDQIVIRTDDDVASRTTSLTADIGNRTNRPVTVVWEQTAGPATSFGLDAIQDNVPDQAVQKVIFPKTLTEEASYAFKVTAKAQGTSVSSDIAFTVTPNRFEPESPRLSELKKLAEIQAEAKPIQPPPVSTAPVKNVGLESTTGTKVVAGSPVTLNFTSPQTATSIDWRVAKGPNDLLQNTTRGDQSITFNAPTAVGSFAVTALATLPNSAIVERSIQLQVLPAPTRQTNRQGGVITHSTIGGNSSDDEQQRQRSLQTFCLLFNEVTARQNITITTADGAVLQTNKDFNASGGSDDDPDVTAEGDCPNQTGLITFRGATLEFADSEFVKVKGSISSQGLVIESARFQTPGTWGKASFLRGALSLPVVSSESNAAGAPLINGGWSSMTGEFRSRPWTVNGNPVSGIPFVPLPAGWVYDQGGFSLLFADSDGTTVLGLTQNAYNSTDGVISFEIDDVARPSGNTISITASNIIVPTRDGGQLAAFGSASFTVVDGETVGTLTAGAECQDSDGCLVYDRVKVNAFEFTLSSAGSGGVSAALTIDIRNTWVPFTATGTYNNAYDFSYSLSGGPIELISGKVINEVTGTYTATPSTETPDTADFTFSLSGTMSGFDVSSGLRNASAQLRITNECPPSVVTGCTTDEMRAFLTLDATADISGISNFPVRLTALVEMASGSFTATMEMHNASLGPKSMNITAAALTITNNPVNAVCGPQTSGDVAPGTLTMGVSAEAEVLGTPIMVAGVVNSQGYCLVGEVRSAEEAPEEEASDSDMEVGGMLITESRIAYSTFPAVIRTLDGEVSIGAKQLLVLGNIELPDSVVDVVGPAFDGKLSISAALGEDGISLSIAHQLDNPIYLFGDSDGDNLSYNYARLNLELSEDSVSITFDIAANYHIKGGADPVNEPGSDTPMVGSLTLSDSGMQVVLGIDISNGPVRNAFGINDLTLNNLAVAATISGGGAEFAFMGDAILPSRWTSKIALVNSPKVRLGYSVNAADPTDTCVEFQIGTRGQAQNSFDLGGFGVLTSKYLRYVFAPRGCELPTSVSGQSGPNVVMKTINPGYAIAFDGAVLGVPITVELELQMTPEGLVSLVDANIEVPAIDLGVLRITGYEENDPVKLKILFKATDGFDLSVKIDGGIMIGNRSNGGMIKVKGSFEQTASESASVLAPLTKGFKLTLEGQGDISLLGMDLSNFEVEANIRGATFAGIPLIYQVDVKGRFMVDIAWGLFQMDGAAALVYNEGELQRLFIQWWLEIDMYIASFGGGFTFSYCKGSPNGDADPYLDYDGCNPGLHDSNGMCVQGVGHYLGAYLQGRLFFLFFDISWDVPIIESFDTIEGCESAGGVIPPGKPGKPQVVGADGSLTVNFVPPTDGGPFSQYVATAYDSAGNTSSGMQCTVANTPGLQNPTCTISGLTNGALYTVFAAVDGSKRAVAEPSDMVMPFAAAPPTAPRILTAEAGDRQLRAQIGAPLEGNAPESYLVTALDSQGQLVPGAICALTNVNDECVITQGIQNGNSYVLKVVGSLPGGGSTPVSTPSPALTPRSTPARPDAPLVAAEDSRLNIAVTPSGGSPDSYNVTAYRYNPQSGQWDLKAGRCFMRDASDPRCVIVGLDNGTAYRVAAVASKGGVNSEVSPLSAPTAPTPPEGVPGVPAGIARNSAIEVTVAPATANLPDTYEATAYRRNGDDPNVWDEASGSCEVSHNTHPRVCTISGLTNGTQYRVSVKGNSEASEFSRVLVPQPLPGQPAPPALSVGSNTITATATRPGGGEPTSYRMTAYDSAGQQVTTCEIADSNLEPLACVLRNLTNDVAYTVRVTAFNGAGSTTSSATTPVTPSAPVAGPRPPTVEVGNGNATVTVNPATSGGQATGYEIRTFDSSGIEVGGATCTVSAGQSPLACTVAGLTNGAGYQFRVIAKNNVSTAYSPDSERIVVGPPGTPNAPSVSMKNDLNTSSQPWAQVTARPGSGGTVTEYESVALLKGKVVGKCTTGSTLKCNIYNLRDGESYTFATTARNGAGDSPQSRAAGPFIAGTK